MRLNNLQTLQDYDIICSYLMELTNGLNSLSGWNIQYLVSQNCVENHYISGLTDIVKLFQEKYPTILSKHTPEEIREQINSTTNLKKFVEIYDGNELSDLHLTITGKLIAAVKIAQFIPNSCL